MAEHYRIYIPKKELKQMLSEGKTYAQIAKHYKCSEKTLSSRINDYGLTSKSRKKEIKRKAKILTAAMAFDMAEKMYKNASEYEHTMQETLADLKAIVLIIKDKMKRTPDITKELPLIREFREVCDSIANSYKEFVRLQDQVFESRKSMIFREQVRIVISREAPQLADQIYNEVILIQSAISRIPSNAWGTTGDMAVKAIREAKESVNRSSDSPNQ